MARNRRLQGLVFSLSAVLAAGCAGSRPFTYLEMRPHDVPQPSKQLTRYHFEYPGGCMDLDVPAAWKLLKSKDGPYTRLGDMETMCATVVTRWDVKPGETLRGNVTDHMARRVAWHQGRAQKLGDKFDLDELDEGMAFDERELTPLTLGAAPQEREAVAHLSAYMQLDVKNRRERTAVTSTMERITTTSTLKAKKLVHQSIHALDGQTRVMIEFNCKPSAWTKFQPRAEEVLDSVRFGTCAR